MPLNYGNTGYGVEIPEIQNHKEFVPKNQHTQNKLLNFENWRNMEVSKKPKISLSKSILYVKNHWNLSNFFSLKNLATNYLFLTYFDCINF